jgi:hypothetical protein
MKYADMREVLVGDVVRLGDDARGSVVADIEGGKYTEGFREQDWSYLKRGVLVESKEMGLIHYPWFDGDIEFVSRASPSST